MCVILVSRTCRQTYLRLAKRQNDLTIVFTCKTWATPTGLCKLSFFPLQSRLFCFSKLFFLKWLWIKPGTLPVLEADGPTSLHSGAENIILQLKNMVVGQQARPDNSWLPTYCMAHALLSVGGCGPRDTKRGPASRSDCICCYAHWQAEASHGVCVCLVHFCLTSATTLASLVQVYLHWLDGKNYTEVTRKWYGRMTVFPFSLVVLSRMHRRARHSVMASLPLDMPLEQRGIEVCGWISGGERVSE